jgi:DNA polymerase-4
MASATILHADLDAFYASVEQVLDPRLRGRAMAVGGSVVLAASYEAKAYGVQGGMPGWRARRLCPGLLFVGGHFSEYQRCGDAVIDVLHGFTPHVERISIDEAFLEVAGAVHLFGSPADIAAQIRARVREELGLPISVGVATTKHLAKVASQVAKPDGLVVVDAGHERAFLAPLPVELLWGVGPKTRARLENQGIRTIGELAVAAPARLASLLGDVTGAKLAALASNIDPRPIETPRRARSMSAQSALGRRRPTPRLLRTELGFLADRVATRLRAAGRAGRTVTVRVRFRGLRAVTRATTVTDPVSTTRALTELGVSLAEKALADHPEEPEITLLAVSVANLVDGVAHEPRRALDDAIDAVRERFGRGAVANANVLFRSGARVPDELRELAQHAEDRSIRVPRGPRPERSPRASTESSARATECGAHSDRDAAPGREQRREPLLDRHTGDVGDHHR